MTVIGVLRYKNKISSYYNFDGIFLTSQQHDDFKIYLLTNETRDPWATSLRWAKKWQVHIIIWQIKIIIWQVTIIVWQVNLIIWQINIIIWQINIIIWQVCIIIWHLLAEIWFSCCPYRRLLGVTTNPEAPYKVPTQGRAWTS